MFALVRHVECAYSTCTSLAFRVAIRTRGETCKICCLLLLSEVTSVRWFSVLCL